MTGRPTDILKAERDHIDKEDNILFMIADMHLDREQVQRVAELFKKVELSGASAVRA